MMDSNRASVILYALMWLARINGCLRRGRQPLLRGPDWFFTVRVPPGFYAGAGRTLLRQYWLRMLAPIAIDIPIAIAICLSGHLVLLNWLMIGVSALIHINHAYSVDLAERRARPEVDEPVATVASSLDVRRATHYANPALEWVLALSTAAAIAWLWYRDPRLLLGDPLRLLYLSVGLLFVKRVIIAWRAPVPLAHAAEHLAARERARRFYLRGCDWMRIALAAQLVYSVVHPGQPSTRWFAVWVALGIAGTVWVEIERKQLARLMVQARPVRLPDFLRQSEIAPWPVCYQPSAPMLMLKGARGYSLNLANRLAHVGAAYLVGLALVFAL